jgi:hypothetical protein
MIVIDDSPDIPRRLIRTSYSSIYLNWRRIVRRTRNRKIQEKSYIFIIFSSFLISYIISRYIISFLYSISRIISEFLAILVYRVFPNKISNYINTLPSRIVLSIHDYCDHYLEFLNIFSIIFPISSVE